MAIIGVTKTLPANVLKLVQDNMVEALLEANGGVPMSPFVEFNLSRPKDPHFSFITVYRKRTSKIDRMVDETSQLKTFLTELAIEIGSVADTEDAVRAENEVRQDAVDTILLDAIENNSEALLEGFDEQIKGLLSFDVTEWFNGQNIHSANKHYIVGAGTLIVSL